MRQMHVSFYKILSKTLISLNLIVNLVVPLLRQGVKIKAVNSAFGLNLQFFSLRATDTLGWTTLCCGGSSMHCRTSLASTG